MWLVDCSHQKPFVKIQIPRIPPGSPREELKDLLHEVAPREPSVRQDWRITILGPVSGWSGKALRVVFDRFSSSPQLFPEPVPES